MSGSDERPAIVEDGIITTTKRECDSCGEMKPDVKFRTWNTFDGSEWEFLCVACAEKKQCSSNFCTKALICLGVLTFVSLMVAAVAFIIIISQSI